MELLDSATERLEVAAEYLEMFQQNTFDFKYCFAPNSMLDWYGCTINGVKNIHNYLMHEVKRRYEHIGFLEPLSCESIEFKASHMFTRILTNKSVDVLQALNIVPRILGPKSYATDNLQDFERINHLPISMELETSKKYLTEKVSEGNLNGNTTERLSEELATSKWAYGSIDRVRTSLNDCLSDENEPSALASLYTSLRYLEVKGMIRLKSITPDIFESTCDGVETRLRISYRRSVKDNEVQFALIIYERIAIIPPNIRRNLLGAF